MIAAADGGAGDNTFAARNGGHVGSATGGAGNDQFTVGSGSQMNIIQGGAGEDQVIVNGATTRIDTGAGNDYVRIGSNGTVGDIAVGNDGDADMIHLGAVDETVCAGIGNPFSGGVADPNADWTLTKNGNPITFNTFEFIHASPQQRACAGTFDKDLDGVRDDEDDCPLTPGNYEDGCALWARRTRRDELCGSLPQL